MTKTLFEQFVDTSNFFRAFQRVQDKNSYGGIDRITVKDFATKLFRNLKELRNDIVNNRYTPEPVQSVSKPKFNDKGEFRVLGLPTVRDKIVQTALLQIVEPLAEGLFLDTSYGYRKDKGHSKAIRRVEHNLANNLQWVVHQDVDNFFDTLDHDRLLRLFAELVGNDGRLVELAALWCRSGIVAKSGKYRNIETGVRQGQVISPLLANLYLHALDEFVANKGWGWVRYADDYLVLVHDEAQANQADREIKEFIETTLHLVLNPNAAPIASLEQGFSFLGILFHGDRREIAAKKIEKMKNKIGWLLSPKNKSDTKKLLRDLDLTQTGWRRYYGFLNPVEQFTMLDQIIEKKFSELADQRITSGGWPEKPPTDLVFPCLIVKEPGDEKQENRLQQLWKKTETLTNAETSNTAKKEADRKIGVRRRQYQRKQVAEGEIIITSPGHFVGRRDGRIVVRRQQTVVTEVPAERFTGLTMGEHGLALSVDVIRFCAEKNITIHFIDSFGKIFAVANRPDGIRAELVQKQIVHRDDQLGLLLAKMFILGKVKNQFALLKSYAKYKDRQSDKFEKAFQAGRMDMEEQIAGIKSLRHDNPADFRNTLMGLEGSFAAKYWRMVGHIIPPEFNFPGRNRHGATDLINSLLNYGYGILYTHALTAVTKAGLNATVGFLHAAQGKKPVLTFDLIEEFRAPVVDRSVFSMLNRREQLGQENNGELNKETRKKIATYVTTRMGGEAIHRGNKDTIKNILYGQALSIRDFLTGKGGYKPFLSRW